MKHVLTTTCLMAVLITGFTNNGWSQIITAKYTCLMPRPLLITYNKTTNLLFPYAIASVDRGSREVLAQKAMGLDNVLQVKAGREDFAETNLSVFTADGTLNSFLVRYAENPLQLNYAFEKEGAAQNKKGLAAVQQTAERIAGLPLRRPVKRTTKYHMRLQLGTIYIQDGVLYFPVQVSNFSNIPYMVQQMRFWMRDNKGGKRTAVQEAPLHPLYEYHPLQCINGQGEQQTVVALPGFTLTEGKRLWIELTEQNGGRNVRLRVSNRSLLNAKVIDMP